MERLGWRYDATLTQIIRRRAREDTSRTLKFFDGNTHQPQNIEYTMMVFHNPEIARLPQHAHLFAEPGCFQSKQGNGVNTTIQQRECGTGAGALLETPRKDRFVPRTVQATGERKWRSRIQAILKERRPPLPRHERNETVMDDFEDEEDVELPEVDHSLNISSHPVGRLVSDWLASGRTTARPHIPVVVWPFIEFGLGNSENKLIELDGIGESEILDMSTGLFDFDPNVVWIGDRGSAYGWNFWCGKFHELVVEAQKKRARLGLSIQWPITIVHFGDGVAHPRCQNVENAIGRNMVRYTMRSLARGRQWKEEIQWVHTGKLLEMTKDGVTYHHSPLTVRTDTVMAVEEVLQDRQMNLSSNIEQLERHYDITHFWPSVIVGDGNDGVGTVGSKLRTRVSKIIADMSSKSGVAI